MTAITPTYAHAYQCICPAGRPCVVPHQKFRLLASKARNPNDFQGWAIYTYGGTRVFDGKQQLLGVLSLACLMEGYLSCLAQLSQPKQISHMHVPESTPTTLLNFQVVLRRFPSLGQCPGCP